MRKDAGIMDFQDLTPTEFTGFPQSGQPTDMYGIPMGGEENDRYIADNGYDTQQFRDDD